MEHRFNRARRYSRKKKKKSVVSAYSVKSVSSLPTRLPPVHRHPRLLLNKPQRPVKRRAKILFHFVLPNAQVSPACCFEQRVHLAVALDVALYFWNPVISVAFDRKSFVFPIVAVPEVAINKNSNFPAHKSDVRSARRALVIAAIAMPNVPQHFAERYLRLGIGRADFLHQPRHLFSGVKPRRFLETRDFYFFLGQQIRHASKVRWRPRRFLKTYEV